VIKSGLILGALAGTGPISRAKIPFQDALTDANNWYESAIDLIAGILDPGAVPSALVRTNARTLDSIEPSNISALRGQAKSLKHLKSASGSRPKLSRANQLEDRF